jgi:AcrR family transcriptional regulator
MAEPALRPQSTDLILDATERLLGRFGFRKMTMEDIAVEAGVARRTIYLHFASKEEVALASIDRVVEGVLAALRAIAAERRRVDARLRDMLVTRVMVRFDRVAAYHEGLETLFADLRPAYLARRERYFTAEAQIFADVLADGLRVRALATDDPMTTAHDLLLATNSLIPYGLSPRELGDRDAVEQRCQRLARLLLDGVRRRPAARQSRSTGKETE